MFSKKKIRFSACAFLAALMLLPHCDRVFAKGEEKFFGSGFYSVPCGKDILLAPYSKRNNDIKWSSSKKSVASVDFRGIVHGASVGKTEITAHNTKSKKEFKCTLEVKEPEPVRLAFVSQAMVGAGCEFQAKAITPKNSKAVKFYVSGAGYGKEFSGAEKSGFGNNFLWSKSIKLPKAGTYSVKAFSNVGGKWRTCSDGNAEIFVANGYNKNSQTSCEKRVSSECARFITSCEGFRPCVYEDCAGIFTIGHGKRVFPYYTFYNHISAEESHALFLKTLNEGWHARAVNRFLTSNRIKFNQHQFNALVSFSYNIGAGWIIHGSELKNILLDCGEKDKEWIGKVCSDNGLWLRNSPSISGKRIKGLKNGESVCVISPNKEKGKWYKVRASNGAVGYCFAEYLKLESVSKGEKDLNRINKNKFINEFLLYHHAARKCNKGLLSRRIYELQMFFHGDYCNLGSKRFNCWKYPIPECAKKTICK